MQIQTSNTLHNAIMEAGSKDRPPMLALGNYVQWKSRIKIYIDTKPNHELIHHCLKNPPYKFMWTDTEVPISKELHSQEPDNRVTENQENDRYKIDMDPVEFSLVYLVITSVFVMNKVLLEAQQISNDSPILGVNIPRCDEDIIKLKATTTVEKVNDDIQLQALIDDMKELSRMGYEKPPPKLTFYKAFFFAQWKFLIHTIVQCISAKRTAWNKFSRSIASVVICLATGRKFNFSKYIFDSMVKNVDSPSKLLMYPHFIQVLLDHQVDDMTTHNTIYKSSALTQKVFTNMRRVRKGFLGVETSLFDSMLVQSQQQAEAGIKVPITHAQPSITSALSPTELQDTTPTPHDTPLQYQPPTPHDSPLQDQPTTPYDSLMALLTTLMETCATLLQKGRTNLKTKVHLVKENVNVASKGVSAVIAPELVSTAEPTVFDDEDVTMTMAQTLIKLKAEKARILYEKIAQKQHDEEVRKVTAREEEERADMGKALEPQRDLDLFKLGPTLSLGRDEAIPEGQPRATSVVETVVESKRPKRVSPLRQPTLTTWIDPEDGIAYIDVPAYPPPAPPAQTLPSPEWSSGSLPISPAPSIIPSPISSPMIPLTIPSLVALPATTETEGFLIELGARVEIQGGLILDHTVQLEERSPALFDKYDRDIGELFTRSKAVRDEIFSHIYRFRSLEHE
nr:hypothetical protein [Tanacetum cinerariifolium]